MLSTLKANLGFKKTPEDLGDGHLAFMCFISYAAGDSPEAKKLQSAFFGDKDVNEMAGIKECADYVDWLIVNHWGEETSVENQET